MAIVPDLSGVRPGRPGNIPASDPRNLSSRERRDISDAWKRDVSIANLVAGNQSILAADKTRNVIIFMGPENGDTVYISISPLTEATGIPIFGGNGFTIRGEAAQQAYYCWGVVGQPLMILVG